MEVTIKELKKAFEETLDSVELSFHLLQTIVDHLPLAVFFEDENGKCTFVNQAFLNLTGLSRDEISSTSWVFCFCRESAEVILEEWCAKTEKFEVFEGEFDITPPRSKQNKFIRVIANPVFHSKIFVGYIGCIKEHEQ